jgi:hypothetical protein
MASSTSSSSLPCSATAKQAWAILHRHARDDIFHLRLQELCRDNDRVSSLVSVYNSESNHGAGTGNGERKSNHRMIMVDLSRQRMTLETLNHLLRLASARNVKRFIRQLSWGQNDPDNPILPARLRTGASKEEELTKEASPDAGAGKGKRHQVYRKQEPICRILSYHLALRVPLGQSSEMLAVVAARVQPNDVSNLSPLSIQSELLQPWQIQTQLLP